MTTETALTLPQRAALALESSKTEMRLRELVASTSDMVEVLNKAARDQIHSAAMTYRDHRVTIEKTGKASRDDATKFSKAVIAEESRLIDIITPEEKRLLALRDAYDAKIEAKRQADISAERERVEEIQAKIDEFGALAIQSAGRDSRGIDALQQVLIARFETLTEEYFEEFFEKAKAAYAAAESALDTACKAALQAERAADAARTQREEEDRQRSEEAAKLIAQRAEQAKVAAAQAAEAKRLADVAKAQQAEIERQQREAQAKIDEAAATEKARQKADADAHAAEMKRQSEELAAKQAEFDRKQAEAQAKADAEKKAKDDAAKLEADHAEALCINEIYSLDVEEGGGYSGTLFHADGKPVYLSPATIGMASLAAKIVIYESAKAVGFSSEVIADALIAESFGVLSVPDTEPTDAEIAGLYIENFGGTIAQAYERLKRFDSAQT